MIIRCYKSAKFQKTMVYHTDKIICQYDIDEVDEIYEDAVPMLNFNAEGIGWISVPIQFVISIQD